MGIPTQSLDFVAANSESLTMSDANFGAFTRAKFSIYGRIQRSSTSGAASFTIMCQQGGGGGDTSFLLRFINDSLSMVTSLDGVTVDGRQDTTATFTSTTDWITILVTFDSANATAGDRMKMWTATNGAALSEVSSFSTDINPTAAVRNSASAMRIGDNGPGALPFDGKIYQLGFFDNVLIAPADVEDSGTPIDISGVSGIWSLVEGDGGVVTADTILATAWTDNNTVTLSDETPFRFVSAAITEEDDTLSSTSFVGITSSLASTEEDDTLSSTSFVGITSSLASTEEDDTLSATTIHTADTSLSSTEEDDTLSSTSFVGISSSLASTEEDDTLSSTSFVGITSSLASTEEDDTMSASILEPVAFVYFNMFNDMFNYMRL